MKINKLSIICILFLLSLISFVYANTSGTNIVISEVLYNANGSNEAGKEWFELYNPTPNAINIGLWSISKESNSPLSLLTFPSGTVIGAYKHLLIGDDGTLPGNLPTPDFITAVSTLYNSGDGISLKNNLGQIVDAVGWASVSNTDFYEGTKIPGGTPDSYSIERKEGIPCGNAIDTNNNANDFFIQITPNPQNSANATEIPCNITSDLIPPSSISNLQLITKTNESITWSWTNPSDIDFDKAIIYLNGINYVNTSLTSAYFYDLENNTAYTITIHTKDFNGNINNTDVSNTQITLQNPLQNDTTALIATVNNVNGDTTLPYNSSANITTFVVDLNEPGDCRMSDNDENYDNMIDNYDCINDGSTQSVCQHQEQANGIYTIYIACKDLNNNKNSNLDNLEVTYTINVFVPEEDLNPPLINNLNANSITDYSAIIFWESNELSNSEVFYGETELFNIIYDSSYILVHNLPLTDLNANTIYYYLVQSCDSYGNCANSTINNFKTLIAPEITDDLQINYLRGKITIDGVAASQGIKYKVEILSGDNIGNNYNGEIDDENVPQFLNNNGYFDTRDQIIFTTGSTFKITSENCTGSYEGQFVDGGNGDFLNESSLINLNCVIYPVIHNVYHSPDQPEENEDVYIFSNVTDNLGIDKVFVNYTVNYGIENLKEMDFNNIYSTNLGKFNPEDIILYNIIAIDSYGNKITSSTYTITIRYLDSDDDGVIDIEDNCPFNINPDQADYDNDGLGDICDNDDDNDGVNDVIDNCLLIVNPGQENNDQDEFGDICDNDDDNDNINDINDNCPLTSNTNQLDSDEDGTGDVCDNYPNDHDNDGYNSDVDCNDNDITINPGAIEIDDNIDQDCINNAPVIQNLNDMSFNEDTNLIINFNDYVNDVDDVESNLLWSFLGNTNIFISVNSNIATLTPLENWYGSEIINFTVKDPKNSLSSTTINITINKLFDDFPSILQFSPPYNPLIGDNILQEFGITINDPDEFNPLINWYINDNLEQFGSNTLFSWTDTENYALKVNITNSTINNEHIWNVEVSKLPVTTYSGTINDVNELNVNGFTGLTIENSYGKIDFGNEIIDLSEVIDVDRYIDIKSGVIGISSDEPGFSVFKNKSAKITMYNLELDNPIKVYFNSSFGAVGMTECPDSICSNINYNPETKILTFDVTGFSTFFVRNRAPIATIITPADLSTYNYGGFTVFSGVAIDNEDGNLQGSNLKWTSSAYGEIGSGEYIATNILPIGANTITLTATDSDSAKGTDKITIYIKEAEVLSSSSPSPDEEDENHDLKINDLTVTPTLYCGDILKIEAEIENNGDYKEDAYLKAKINVLGINEKSDEVKIDQDEKENLDLDFKIPGNVKENSYTLKIEVYSEDGDVEDTEEENIHILCNNKVEKKTSVEENVNSEVIFYENSNKKQQKIKTENSEMPQLSSLVFVILLMIIICIYLIKRIVRRY